MREILFKGKRKENGKWIEGYYQKRYDDFENIQHLIFWAKSSTVWEYAEIDPETVCQYTCLTDKNGRKIFEGDILKNWNGTIYEVIYDSHSGAFCFKNDALLAMFRICGFEIIGNIFDNPELIGDQP